MDNFEKYKFILGCIGVVIVIIVLLLIFAGVNRIINLTSDSYDRIMNSIY